MNKISNDDEKMYEQLQKLLKESSWEDVEDFINVNPSLNLNKDLPNNKKPISMIFEKFLEDENKDVKLLKQKIMFLHSSGATLDQVTLNNEPVWFLSALQTKDEDIIDYFLKASEPDNRPWDSYQAFLYACQEDVPVKVLRSLITDPFIDVSEVNEAGENALFFAASQKDRLAADRVFSLLHSGINIDSLNKNRETPLFSAVEEGVSKSIKLLLTANANPNALDIDGNTPLFKVHFNSNITDEEKEDIKKKVTYLLEAGASLDVENNMGQKLRDKPEFKEWLEWMDKLVEKKEISALVREIPTSNANKNTIKVKM